MDRTNKTGIKNSKPQTGDEFREIFNQSPIGILFYDKEGKLIEANQSALEIAGITSLDDVKGIYLFDNPHVALRKEKLLEKGLIKFHASLDLDNIKKIGFYTPQKSSNIFIDYVVSITNSGYLVQIQDITERKKAEEQIQKLLEESQQLNEELEVSNEELQATTEELQVANEELQSTTDELRQARDHLEELVEKRTVEVKKLADIVESSDDAIIGKDLNSIIISWNRGAEKLYGYSAQEIIGKHISVLMEPEQWEKVSKLIEKVKKGQYTHYESKRLRKDGSKIDVSIILSPIKRLEGEIIGISIIARDITKNKRAEAEKQMLLEKTQQFAEELEVSNEELQATNKELEIASIYNRSLIEASVDPLVTIGPDGKITDVNNSTELVTGYLRDELIGTDFSDYFSEPGKARSGYKQVFEEGFVHDYPLEIKHKDGNLTPVLYNASVYQNLTGEVLGVFAAARDITERKKAEEKIQELANVVESSNDAIITKSLEGVITSWNKGAEQIYGYSAEEMLGKSISILEPNNLKGETKQLIEKVKHGELIQHYEALRRKKDNSIINMSITLSPVFDTSGKLMAISTIARDVTERKKSEEALRLSNIYNRSLIEASMDPLVTIGPDGKITDVNDSTEMVTGYSRDELIGTDFSDYFSDPGKARSGYKQVFSEGFVRDYSLEIKHKSGRITPVLYNASIYKNESDEVIGVFAAARDITERKKAEEQKQRLLEEIQQSAEKLKVSNEELQSTTEELQVSNEELQATNKELEIASIYNRSLIEASVDPLVTIGPDGKITDVNYSTESVTGYIRDDLIGTDFSDYFSEPEKAKEGYQQVFREGEVRDYSLEIQHKDGQVTPVLYNASVYQNLTGEVLGVFAAARDITERKKAEEALKELIDELQRSNYELQQFAYITSHDLQEPLRSIASYSQLIQRRYKGQLDSDADDFIDFMVSAAVRMKEMINGLLDYSRIGTQEKELQQVDTEKVLGNVLSNLNTTINENNAEITYENLPTVTADKGQLNQLFQNIIGNAIKFKKPDKSPKINISVQKEENEYIFSVNDNGIGMEPEYMGKIFEVFKRLHTIDAYEGTGIGLAIVKRIIERHGGRVWVESDYGVGSTFYFTIPVESVKNSGIS